MIATLMSRARADEPAPAAPPPAAAKPADGNSLDFDLFGDKKPPPPGVDLSLPPTAAPKPDSLMLAKQVKKRRLMLQLHQGFGFATLALLAATCVLGQLQYDAEFTRGGTDHGSKLLTAHESLAYASTATFATTGLLGLIAPTPYKKPLKLDAALLHKVMMGLATAGFVAQIALGLATAANGGQLFQRDLAIAHLTTGYVTFAAMTTGYLAFVF